jgi:hypothetical protein
MDLSDLPLPGHVIGIFNWGSNLDLGTFPYTVIPEEARDYNIDLESLGINGRYWGFEYWSRTPLGEVEGDLLRNIPARDCRLLILRPLEDQPQVVSSNRHILQGATDLTDIVWDAESSSLRWRQKVVKGFPHRVRVTRFGFPGLEAEVTQGDAVAGLRQLDDDFYELEIIANQTEEIQVEVYYRYCFDQDGDGYGLSPNIQCESTEPDCDDTDPLVYPGGVERWYNGVDDDCNPLTPDGPFWEATTPAEASTPGAATSSASDMFNGLCWIGISLLGVLGWRKILRRRRAPLAVQAGSSRFR